MNIAISGSNGYLGKKIRNSLKNNGFKTYGLCRKPKNKNDFKFILDDNSNSHQVFKKNKIQTFIHCAWDLRNLSEDQSYKINVIGSKKILDEAIKGGAKKIIFISSMSAFEGCKSIYGKQKLEVENYYLKKNASIIRPGLIWGDQKNGGLYKKLNNISKLPFVIPIIFSKKQHLYLLNENDLIEFIKKQIKTKKNNSSINTIANSNALSLKQIIKICQIKNGNKAFLIPIPWQILWVMLRIAETFKVRVPFRSDSLVGLINSNPNPFFSDYTKNCRSFN